MRQFQIPHPFLASGNSFPSRGVRGEVNFRIHALFLSILLILTGCNLNAPEDSTPEDSGQASANPTICVPISGWQTYVVQPGDTLTIIADVSSSTVDELADANCLANRNRLVQGQYLRVPALPSDATTPAQTCPLFLFDNQGTDYVLIPNAEPLSVDCVRLRPGVTYTISWENAPANTPEVTFYRVSELNANTRPDVIGVDNNGADGFSIEWLANAETPPSVVYAIAASGGNSDGLGVLVEE